MKVFFSIATIALAIGCASAQTEPAHERKVTLKVVDETRQPVAGAETWVNYLTNQFIGFTDTNGIFTASHRDHSSQLAFQAQKAGFYTVGMQYQLGFHYDPVKWNPTVELLLNRIINPIPMYAKSVNLGMPLFDKPAGFDLMVGDWVSPYGKGASADIIFTAHFDKRAQNDFDYKLTVSFPNSGDGIQIFTLPGNEKYSGLRSPHEAPDRGYQPELVREHNERPDKILKYDNDPNGNYFLRIRTVLDDNGNVKSALYGKIYGDFMQFTYYLNPTPNSRNMEFDPKHNLLSLKPREIRIQAP